MWVPLLEKAYAKLHGSYLLLESGWTGEGFVDLTGGCNELVQLDEGKGGKFDYMGGIWGILSRCNKEGWLLGCSCEGGREVDSGVGILTGHAYSVIDCREVAQYSLRLIRIRNPWGKKEWTGRWSDTSQEWNPYYEQLFNYKRDANDGSFWMQLEDFQHYYSRLFVCRLYSDAVGDQYFRYMMHGQWSGRSAGGCSNNSTWKDNPQFGLTVHESANICVSLTQQDVRMLNNSRDEYHVGFGVYKSTDNSKKKTHASSAEQICKSGSFLQKREVLCEWNFGPGQYVIVPSTFEAGQSCKFTIVVYSSKQATLHEIKADGSVEVTTGNPLDQVVETFAGLHLGAPAQNTGYVPPSNAWGHGLQASPPPATAAAAPQQPPYNPAAYGGQPQQPYPPQGQNYNYGQGGGYPAQQQQPYPNYGGDQAYPPQPYY
jgi:hypothetical protein